MDTSIFSDKNKIPSNEDLSKSLAFSFEIWKTIVDFVIEEYPAGVLKWNYPGAKFGWSLKIMDKKRAIIYLLPRDKYFKVALIFGQKAFEKIMKSRISKDIRTELEGAKVYAEGRGVRIEVRDKSILEDIKELIRIKLLF